MLQAFRILPTSCIRDPHAGNALAACFRAGSHSRQTAYRIPEGVSAVSDYSPRPRPRRPAPHPPRAAHPLRHGHGRHRPRPACSAGAGLLSREPATPAATGGAASLNPLAPKAPQFAGKAKRVIHLFMNGGPSQVDTFDPKPALAKYAGKPLPMPNLKTERKTGAAFPSPFKFQKYGQSGIEVSELFPHIAEQHRRHLRDPLDARRRAQPRAVAAADELRRGPAGPPEHGLVGHLRPGHREPEPARLHRHVPRRLPDPGIAELAERLPARRAPGHLHRHQPTPTSRS